VMLTTNLPEAAIERSHPQFDFNRAPVYLPARDRVAH
jgi:hypothetical protein